MEPNKEAKAGELYKFCIARGRRETGEEGVYRRAEKDFVGDFLLGEY